MSDINPEQLKQVADSNVWAGISAVLVGAVGAIGGFVFKDHNRRLQLVEAVCSKVATPDDIAGLHKKMDEHIKDQAEKSEQVAKELGALGANVSSMSTKTDQLIDALINRGKNSRSDDN